MTSPSENLFQWLSHPGFPCVGAKTALALQQIHVIEAHDLRCPANDAEILQALQEFVASYDAETSKFQSVAVVFKGPLDSTEEQFEAALWQRLQALHDRDDEPWDARVSSDPASQDFSFSLAGKAFYVVGMHPGSSRPARRSPSPTLIFNLHEQFEELRASGEYARMQKLIRRRDTAFSGSINPMLADFHSRSEALQYSGRQVGRDWVCPFAAHS